MSNYLIFILLMLSLSPSATQSPVIVAEKWIVNSYFTDKEDEKAGIIYFSADNGITWKNTSIGIPEKVRIGLGGVATSDKKLGVATKEYGVFIYNFSEMKWVNIPTEKQIIDGNIGTLALYKNDIYIGTQHKGIFYSRDNGKTWLLHNSKLTDLNIRRFFESEGQLYVCTNDGFYLLNEKTKTWKTEYSENSLQVNGATVFKGILYIATSKGVYKKDGAWKNILPNHSVHNISSDSVQIYAMTYNELLLTSNDGMIWRKDQEGLPKDLYTFNVINQNGITFAGQWDGIYIKTKYDKNWKKSSTGLPDNFAVTNLKSINGILIITTSERKLKGNR